MPLEGNEEAQPSGSSGGSGGSSFAWAATAFSEGSGVATTGSATSFTAFMGGTLNFSSPLLSLDSAHAPELPHCQRLKALVSCVAVYVPHLTAGGGWADFSDIDTPGFEVRLRHRSSA